MKCSGCSLQGDKYVLFNCDCCGNTQCKECGDFTASEEKCFPLMKRRVLLYCPQCFEKLKEKKQNLEAVIVTLQQQLKSVNGELQTCKNLHTDDEIETREPSSNFRIAKQGEVVTTDQLDKMLENLQICFEKRLDTKKQKLVENFDNKITNLKAPPDYRSNPLLFREDIKKGMKNVDKKKTNTIKGNLECTSQNIVVDQRKLMEDIIDLDKLNSEPICPTCRQTYA
ncbi:hypothetical protein WA026_021927 [Henosepilachna vigintioctopunctata]|uniref:Uncharacterized protein n=1 Tax=Henosepilachna vigintioctopunctata TaxID=420089 RepID=A0AAW1VD75_9CUCU